MTRDESACAAWLEDYTAGLRQAGRIDWPPSWMSARLHDESHAGYDEATGKSKKEEK